MPDEALGQSSEDTRNVKAWRWNDLWQQDQHQLSLHWHHSSARPHHSPTHDPKPTPRVHPLLWIFFALSISTPPGRSVWRASWLLFLSRCLHLLYCAATCGIGCLENLRRFRRCRRAQQDLYNAKDMYMYISVN